MQRRRQRTEGCTAQLRCPDLPGEGAILAVPEDNQKIRRAESMPTILMVDMRPEQAPAPAPPRDVPRACHLSRKPQVRPDQPHPLCG